MKIVSIFLVGFYSCSAMACNLFNGKYKINVASVVHSIEIDQTGCEKVVIKFPAEDESEEMILDGKFREFASRSEAAYSWNANQTKILEEDHYQFNPPYSVLRIYELLTNGDIQETSEKQGPTKEISVLVYHKS